MTEEKPLEDPHPSMGWSFSGHALDFEGWRQMGCEGWGYDDVLPYFREWKPIRTSMGGEGPLNVHRPTPENPIYKAFLAAGHEAGYDLTEDICGYQQEGFGVLDMSIHKGNGKHCNFLS